MNIHQKGPFEQKKKENKDSEFIESKGNIYATFLRTKDRVSQPTLELLATRSPPTVAVVSIKKGDG